MKVVQTGETQGFGIGGDSDSSIDQQALAVFQQLTNGIKNTASGKVKASASGGSTSGITKTNADSETSASETGAGVKSGAEAQALGLNGASTSTGSESIVTIGNKTQSIGQSDFKF